MIPDHPALVYAVALALTLAIETPIVALALARWYRVRPARGAALALIGSVLTHPIVWFVLPAPLIPAVGSLGYLLAAEGFAWLAEAAVFWLATRRDPFGLLLVSLMANTSSFMVGGALRLAGLW